MPVDVLLVLVETAVLGVTYSFCELKEAFSPTRERDIAFNTPLRPAIFANTTHTLSPRASACSLDNIIGGLAEAVDHSDTAIFADGVNRTCQEPESCSNNPRGDLLYTARRIRPVAEVPHRPDISQVQIRAPPRRIHRPYLSEKHNAPTWYLT